LFLSQNLQKTGDADETLKKLVDGNQRLSHIEMTILRTISLLKKNGKSKNPSKSAILALTRETRSLYIHSYQSLVFNRIVSRFVLNDR
jgi:tRNA(Glu) U13 pseudouridine synthase TruD